MKHCRIVSIDNQTVNTERKAANICNSQAIQHRMSPVHSALKCTKVHSLPFCKVTAEGNQKCRRPQGSIQQNRIEI